MGLPQIAVNARRREVILVALAAQDLGGGVAELLDCEISDEQGDSHSVVSRFMESA